MDAWHAAQLLWLLTVYCTTGITTTIIYAYTNMIVYEIPLRGAMFDLLLTIEPKWFCTSCFVLLNCMSKVLSRVLFLIKESRFDMLCRTWDTIHSDIQTMYARQDSQQESLIVMSYKTMANTAPCCGTSDTPLVQTLIIYATLDLDSVTRSLKLLHWLVEETRWMLSA